MKPLLAAVVLLLALPALADREAVTGRDRVRLTASPCAAAVLDVLPAAMDAQTRAGFRAARVEVDGQAFVACWLRLPNGDVLLRYDDADTGLLPWAWFREVPEA